MAWGKSAVYIGLRADGSTMEAHVHYGAPTNRDFYFNFSIATYESAAFQTELNDEVTDPVNADDENYSPWDGVSGVSSDVVGNMETTLQEPS